MSFNDDEPIVTTQDAVSGGKFEHIDGLTKAKIISKKEAPLEGCTFKVMLELSGAGSGQDRPGLDLVTVLDVSGSMRGEKVKKMKTAMQFVIKKLGSIDRLSIVTFSGSSKRLFPLRQMTKNSQEEIEAQVDALVAGGGTNIAAGLQTGLKVLNDRSLTDGRIVGMMLMSDGEESTGDAANVPLGDVSVHTFSFGEGSDPKVLKAISDNKIGSTFSAVQDLNNLSKAFSQCLAGLLSVVVQGLTLTITTKDESKIDKVYAGNYPQSSRDDKSSSITVSFGDLYRKEIRKVIVELLLPTVSSQFGAEVVRFSYTYMRAGGGKPYEAKPLRLTVVRTGTSVEPEKEELVMEEKRLQTADSMKQARLMADDNKLQDARNKLLEAEQRLTDVGVAPNVLIETLIYELQHLSKLMQTPDIYEKQGRSFALSSEASHELQRFTARGDMEMLRLFSTPLMNAFLKQAVSFDKDSNTPVPTLDDDVKQEIIMPETDPQPPNPQPSLVGNIINYIQAAFQYFKSCFDMLFNRMPLRA